MKFTITNKSIKKPLSLCSIIAPTSSPMRILENIWFQDGKLVAGDGQSQISVACAVQGDFTVPADKLKKLVSAFSDDAELAFELKGDKLTVKSGKSRLTLPVTASDMFPSPSLGGTTAAITLKQEDIKYHIKNVIYAMSSADVRQWMNAILFRNDSVFMAAATTGIELATSTQAIDASPFEFSLPASVVSKVEKLMTDGPVTLNLYENKAVFVFNDIELIVPLMEEKFRDVMRAIPKLSTPLTFDKKEFMNMSERAAVNVGKFGGSLFKLSQNELIIECKDFGAESSDSMVVSYSGDPREFGYNILQLRAAISSIQSDNVEMHIAENGTVLIMSDGGLQRNVVTAMRV